MQDSGKQYSQCGNARSSSKERTGLGWPRRIVVLLFALIISNLTVWANSETSKADSFSPYTRVMLFSSDTGQWVLTTFAQAEPGNEFYFNNQLYRTVDSDKAQVVPNINADALFEADRPYDKTSRRPGDTDVVQVLDKEMRCTAHAAFGTVQSGGTIRFQGKAYTVAADLSLADTGIAFSAAVCRLQRIEITKSGWQHVIDRHTAGGTMNAGKTIFFPEENIQALIKNAELATPVLEENGYLKRVFDAGRNIGIDRQKRKQTSTYRVITTQTGKLVTAYPVLK